MLPCTPSVLRLPAILLQGAADFIRRIFNHSLAAKEAAVQPTIHHEDTIVALATPPGEGGIAILRISGPRAEEILLGAFRPRQKAPMVSHMLTYGQVLDGEELVDEAMAVVMRAPRSYTREDVAEIHLHGGKYVVNRTLTLCCTLGARLAQPGEFTRRAFLNGRIDLSQAEAVMNLISAGGQAAHRAAVRQLQGGPSQFIRQAADELYHLQAAANVSMDYPEEISEAEATADLLPRILALAEQLDDACDQRAARLMTWGLFVTLCGRPNVGKSSLLNALLGEDRAIVTNIPGTTRDTITGTLTLQGIEVHLTDTAGLREADDPVEQLGVARSEKALQEADVVLAVLDSAEPLTKEDVALLQRLRPGKDGVVLSKSDLPAALTPKDLEAHTKAQVFLLSARQSGSLTPLKDFLASQGQVADRMSLTQPRQIASAQEAAQILRRAASALEAGTPIDLVAMELTLAQHHLGEITGDRMDQRVLDAVFQTFCVGK